jgi:2-polyprenyl-3-methyl-5-hydroxy-6-metoxy-1,4-benzoquinol methylase
MKKKELKLMSWPVRLPSSFFTGFLMINHPPVEGGFEYGWGKPVEERDDKLLAEVCDYFESRIAKESLDTGSETWESIVPTHAEFIEKVKARDYDWLHEHLRNMFQHPITYGLAQGDFFYKRLQANQDDIQKNTAFAVYDKFICLLEALGLIPAFSPEQYLQDHEYLKYYTVGVDEYVDMIEQHLGVELEAPKYSGSHFGIQTEKHGLYSDRDIMALGVAIRITESYWNRKDIKIADIGSGLGYLPYYLKKLGFNNITHVDLPTVSTAAKYFLDTNMPDHGIKFMSPEEFDGNYDLVVNLDGLTTYGKANAEEYMKKISENAKHFLSINRECDAFRVFDICDMRRITRNPFWYRRGYIEEDYVPEKK